MNKNNLKNLVHDENHEIWTKLAEQILDIDSGVKVFLDVEKDIEAKEGILSIGFAHYPMNDTEIILHRNTSCSPFVDYKDDFLDAYIDGGEIAKLALANWQYGFCDGVVQMDMGDMSLHGASFTTGTLENPNNPFVEVYRIKQTSEFDLCSDCLYCEGCNKEEYIEVCRYDFIVDELYAGDIIDEVFDAIPHEVFVKFVANQIYTYVYNMIS